MPPIDQPAVDVHRPKAESLGERRGGVGHLGDALAGAAADAHVVEDDHAASRSQRIQECRVPIELAIGYR